MITYKVKQKHSEDVLSLLKKAGLGTGTMEEVNLWRLAYDNDVLIGCGGIVYCGEYAYLRSLAIDEAWRGQGIGGRINEDLQMIATMRGASAVYMMTAQKEFFEARGYVPVCGSDVPEEILAVGQLGDACCLGCDMMRMDLDASTVIMDLHQDWYGPIASIYRSGIKTGIATFETSVPPDFCYFIEGKDEKSLIGHVHKGRLLSWAVLSPTSKRKAYAGVGEVSVYIHPDYQGLGLGREILAALIEKARSLNYWTIQSGIISKNTGSLKLHEELGFRHIGFRESISQMQLGPYKGQWMNVELYELKLTTR